MSLPEATASLPHVVPTLDGVNAAGSAASPIHVAFTGSADSQQPAITCATDRAVEVFSPVAKGATVHAQVASGAAVALASAFTVAFPARNVVIQRGGAGNATVYTITGTRLGAAQTETLNSAGAADIVGVKAWDTIATITSDVDAGVTSDFVTGDLIGLQRVAVAIDRGGVQASAVTNAVVETFTLNALKDAFTPTTATNGAKYFRVQYSFTPTATQAAHTHTVTP